MLDMLPLIASIIVAFSVFAMVAGYVLVRSRQELRERLDTYLAGEAVEKISVQDAELAKPFSERVFMPVVRVVARMLSWLWPKNRLDALHEKITLAGTPGNITPLEWMGIRSLCLVVLLSVGLLYGFLMPEEPDLYDFMMLGALCVCGFFLPDFWLSRRVTMRQRDIINSLPDALDMLMITTEAGLSFESGLQEMVTKWRNELSREFARVLRDVGMGQSRRQALLGLSERTGVPDISNFVASLNQAEELGVSIGRVLRAQSEDMRVKRRQRAQEKANQAPVKMMFPLVFLIFPAIFAVLLGPAVPQLMNLGV